MNSLFIEKDKDECVISIKELSKTYKLYDNNKERLIDALNPFSHKNYKEFHALKNVSLDFKKGETIGLIGKNGAGKSTLLKIITGIVTPTSGSVHVKGKIASLLELGAGFNMEMTGIENIFLNGSLMGFTKNEISGKLNSILEFADIGEFVHQPVKMYSSGMFARLAFSVAINVNPDILIIDEALSVGDLRFQLKCMEKFNEFREVGKTIIFVSHDINAIKRFCTCCVWINQGRLEESGDTDIVTDRYLDFLKIEGEKTLFKDYRDDANNIAHIEKVRIIKNELDVEKINFKDAIEIEVYYTVFEDNIVYPVLGVSINSLDNKNICGLNTLLDNVTIPWKKGVNKFSIKYQNINLIGGSYIVDVALFERNATVSFDYKAGIKQFSVQTPYVGEGIFILEHEWRA